MAITFKPFDAKTVPLAGINLIEASAGTGKTYSIALLVLRLIIEKEIPVKEILMVTFTKAAVAELEERIRLFVRKAYKQAQSQELLNDDIGKLLASAIEQTSHQNVQDLLKNAVLFLDETSVLTIHSFCQLTLTEFAFETQQLFGAELLQDTETILQDEVNQFWRSNVTNIDTELLTLLLNNKLCRDEIKKAVQQHLSGKKFFIYDDNEDYRLDEKEVEETILTINSLEIQKNELWENLEDYVLEHIERLKKISLENGYAKKTILANFDDATDCLNFINTNSSAYIKKLYPDILELLESCNFITQQINQITQQVINKISCNAINQVSEGVNNYKLRNNQLSYDDLISNLNKAILKSDNSKLIEGLQLKYKAVFIDEFQDTDRKQYQIFDTAFNQKTIVFYIGDPKQSIYAWRKADIFTYFEAQKAAYNCYEMNQNFRSSRGYIDAMNLFFAIEDAFHFKGSEQTIDYVIVDSPTPNTKANLLNDNQFEVPITLTVLSKNEEIENAVANQISELLKPNSPFVIQSEPVTLSEAKSLINTQPVIQSNAMNPQNTRPIKPSDIGILVRTKGQGKAIQSQLTKLGIPSVAITEAKILQSAEATNMLYFLEAVADISRSNINRALLSPFTGYQKLQILALDVQHATQLFRKYKTLWDTDGVFTTIKTFMADYDTVKNLSQQNALQTLTNLQQLTELLHKTQTSKKLSDLDLINWLKRGTEGQANDGDEYQQRIENDEEAVKIVTIHSSKGLEYNIVFAPYLDFAPTTKHTFCSFREPQTGQYVNIAKADLTEEQVEIVKQQEDQENSRLIYVAITRAVYKCFIYRNNYYKTSALTHFTKVLNKDNPNLIIQTNEYPTENHYSPIITSLSPLPATQSPVNFQLQQKYWYKLSYSFLKAPYANHPTIKSNQKLNAYGNFIFNDLAKGAKTGNMLHNIFENIHLDNPKTWPRALNNAIKGFAIKETENFSAKLLEMLHHTLNATINIDGESFRLSAVNAQKCINELEFDFTVSPFKIPQLKTLEDENIEISLNTGSNLEGVMNGKIDLFFEHQGKYYVLDWKSNFLGDSIENYKNAALNQAMNQNNYHLQYLIYTLACKKYLESRLPNFDYETQFGGVIYVFVRGVREGLDDGIFVNKPSEQKIHLLAKILGE
ncbi:MAG: hypothetical protein EAZ15_03135 [Sphingobacteriales bacterium]|nr:MAG: hypothetical protein EAZ15_03135 [Sphingobacteriales bacterium]